MESEYFCPVPTNQIPLFEFNKLTKSHFYSWPLDKNRLYLNLAISWFLFLLLSIFIGTGSILITHDYYKLLTIELLSSLLLPIILIAHLLISWQYILKRLLSENIEYEKSGWFDGSIWQKPNDWRVRDLLIAQYEVKPIIKRLMNPLKVNVSLITLTTSIYFLFFIIL